jgi:hypothetical protein
VVSAREASLLRAAGENSDEAEGGLRREWGWDLVTLEEVEAEVEVCVESGAAAMATVILAMEASSSAAEGAGEAEAEAEAETEAVVDATAAEANARARVWCWCWCWSWAACGVCDGARVCGWWCGGDCVLMGLRTRTWTSAEPGAEAGAGAG